MAQPRYTILIATWNGDDLLRDCLDSIAGAVRPAPPCVVVDNAGAQSTREICAGHPFVKYLAAPSNLGFAGGNNFGLPLCGTEFVCLLNNDTIVNGDPFATLVGFMDAHPRAGVAQGTLTLPRLGGVLDECGSDLSWNGRQRYRLFGKPDPGNLAPARVFSAKGAFMMIRRSAIDRAGGFLFHGHFGNYYEETDFCHRVWISGGEVWFVPTQPIQHLCGMTSGRLDNDIVIRQYLANILFSFSANFSSYGRLRVLLPFAIGCIAYAALQLLALRWKRFAALLAIPAINRRRRASLLETRRIVRASRVLPDAKFLTLMRRLGDGAAH